MLFLGFCMQLMFTCYDALDALCISSVHALLWLYTCPVCINCTYQENYYIMGVHVKRKIIDGVHRVYLVVQDLGC